MARQREASPPSTVNNLSPHAWRIAFLWTLLLLAYSNSFSAALLFDNIPAIVQDPRIQSATLQNVGSILTEGYWQNNPNSGLYRPLTTFSYLVNYAILGNGVQPAGYHWVNFALHAVNVALLYALGLLILSDPTLAIALAALWGVHPLLTEAVTNIVGRADLLATFGVLAGLLCYVKTLASEGSRRWAWVAALIAAQTVGLFSKESAAVLPAILLLYDLIWHERSTWRRRTPAYLALALPFAIFFFLRGQLHTHMQILFLDNPLVNAGFWTARLTAIKVIGKMLWMFLWPANLSADYSYNAIPLSGWQDASALIFLAICVTAAVLAFRWRRTWKALSFFIVFFFVAIMPTANLLVIIGAEMAERFVYLPAIGLAGCAVIALQQMKSQKAARIAMGVICLGCIARTYARNADWHDEIALWTSAVRANPNAAKSHLNLGHDLAQIPGRLPDAMAEWRETIRIYPDLAEAHYDLATALAQTPGQLPAAIAEYRAALRLQPESADTHNNLAIALAQSPDKLSEAITEWQTAIKIQPSLSDAHFNLGNAYSQIPGRTADAISEWQAALRIDPNLAEAHYNLGKALSQIPGRLPEAISEVEAALRLSPNPEIRQTLTRLRSLQQ